MLSKRKDTIEPSIREQTHANRTSPTSSYFSEFGIAGGTKQADECDLLNKLIYGFNLKNDAQLAAWLNIDKSLIYATRAGKRRLGIVPRMRIMDGLEFLKVRSILEAIQPENLVQDLAALNQKSGQKLVPTAFSTPVDNLNIAMLEGTKMVAGYDTDAELAKFLGIAHNTVATIRAGKSALGPKPRLRIFGLLNRSLDTEMIIDMLDSTKKLLGLMDKHLNLRPMLGVNYFGRLTSIILAGGSEA